MPQHGKADADLTEENRQTLAEVATARAALRRRIRTAELVAGDLHEATGGRLSLAATCYDRPVSWEQAHQEAGRFGEAMLDGR